MKHYVKDLYKKLSGNMNQTPEAFYFDYFKLEGEELYYRGRNEPLKTEGKLKSVGEIASILGKNRLRNLGFDIPRGKLTAWQAVILNRVKEELPSTSDITKAARNYGKGIKEYGGFNFADEKRPVTDR